MLVELFTAVNRLKAESSEWENRLFFPKQCFQNFFKRDPKLSLMNISRPKPIEKNVFSLLRKRKSFKLIYYYIAT